MLATEVQLPNFPHVTYVAIKESEYCRTGLSLYYSLKSEFEPLAQLRPGYYRINETGEQFFITEGSDLVLTSKNHTFSKFSKEYWNVMMELYPEQFERDEHHEVNCSSCGDGGCVHCGPKFFM